MWLFAAVSQYAQDGNVSISGIVTDKTTGEILIGTNILLFKDSLSAESELFKGTATNRYGFYAITSLGKGKYYLVAKNLGFKTLANEIFITVERGKVDYNIELVPDDVELEEVVITGEKTDEVSISTIKIPAKLVELLPSLSGETNIFKSLQLLPGVQVASELSNGLYIRGGSPDQTLTLVDGMVLYNPSHLGNFTSTFNSNAVQDIKLIKGAFPAEYGGRLSSILDIKLRSGTREKESVDLGVGTINSFVAMEGPLTEKSTYMIAGRAMYYDLILKNFMKDSNIPRYGFYDMNSKFTYTLPDNNIVSISAVYSRDRLYNPDNDENLRYDIAWKNGAFNINWLKIHSTSIFTNTTFNYIDYSFQTNISDTLDNTFESDYYSASRLSDLNIRSVSEIRWNNDNTLKLGTDLTYHMYEVKFSNYYSYALEKSESLKKKNNSIEAALFFQNESNFGNLFLLNIGARYYYFSGSRYSKFEPRVSLAYSPFNWLSIKMAAANAHQFLHLLVRNDKSLPTDLWYSSTKQMKPSSSWQYVFGLESYFYNREYLISAETYYRDMKNLYEFREDAKFDPYESLESQITKGTGESYGFEFFINKRAGNLAGWAGYTISWTERKFEELNNGVPFYPNYDRRHDVSIALTYKLFQNLSVGATWVYSTGRRMTLPSGQYIFRDLPPFNEDRVNLNVKGRNEFLLPDYHKMDLNITYTFKINNCDYNAYLNIYNVYNRYNVFSYYISNTDKNGEDVPVIKQIVLFPFLPSVGIKMCL